MRAFAAVFFILLLSLVAPARADSEAPFPLRELGAFCTGAYKKVASAFGFKSVETASAARFALRERGVVTIEKERFLKFDRDGREWVLLSDSDYFRGDPKWNVELAGQKTMEDLGFRYEDHAFFSPVAETYNGRIEKLNKTLRPDQQIAIRYYTPDADKVGDEEYVRRLARFEHPASPGNRGNADEAPHDANFHAPLLPKQWYEQIARRAGAWVGFLDWLRANRPSLYETGRFGSTSVKEFFDSRLRDVGTDLDLVTAVVLANPNYPQRHYPVQALWQNGYAGMVQHLLFDGQSTVDVLVQKNYQVGKNKEFDDAFNAYIASIKERPENQISISKTAQQVQQELDARLQMFRSR